MSLAAILDEAILLLNADGALVHGVVRGFGGHGMCSGTKKRMVWRIEGGVG